ncbi:MAG: hypothetical protein ACI8QZ_001047 [Chlamydiales bacterium]|jgi:hypothetical protein
MIPHVDTDMCPTRDRSKASIASLASILLGLLSLGSCTTTTSKGMVPVELDIIATHPQSISVHAEGTPRRFGFGPPFVQADVLAGTIEEAILKCELFDAIVPDKHADYLLHVAVTELDKPESGLDMTAGITMRWSLSKTDTRATVWIDTVTTAFTSSTNQSAKLEERLRTSIEGALRENIELGLNKLSAVDLPGSLAVE